ncbi:MAG: MFS transporter [Burkholderiales bacterium]|nr:MFS transporter [Burkholderiales bacterium]
MSRAQLHGHGPFRGWIVTWAAFTCLTVIFGASYSFAAFFKPWAHEFSATRAEISWVFGLSSLLYFMLGAVAGALADRFGPRAIGVVGVLILTGGLVASSRADDLLGVYLGYGLGTGLGVALVYLPAMGAVQPWFVKHRGLASGIASAGIGAGTLVVPILTTWLIDAHGWRAGLQLMAAGALLIGIAAAWLLERDPAARGWQADGVPLPHTPAQAAGPASEAEALAEPMRENALPDMNLRSAASSISFRWLYGAVMACSISMFVPVAHLSAAARDQGIADTPAVALVSLIGIGSLLGRFFTGAMADRLGRLRTHVLMQAALGASFLLWALAGGYPTLVAFALLFGLTYGGLVAILPPICTDLFGLRAVSAIIGLLYSGTGIGALIGPVASGALFDHFHHYGATIALCLLSSAVATACAWQLVRHAEHRTGGRKWESNPPGID